MQGVTRSYDYFMKGRKWFFGALLLVQAMDIGDSFVKGYDWGMRPELLSLYVVTIAVAITGIISESRSVQLGTAGVAVTSQLLFMFQELNVLG